MLVVTIELWPGGSRELRRSVGAMHIANASQLSDVSDYRILAQQSANPLTGEAAGFAEFEIVAHSRNQSVWALVKRACEEAMKADWDDLPDRRRSGPLN